MASRRFKSDELGGADMTDQKITVEAVNIPSTDGIHTLQGIVYYPQSEIPFGILHIAHGMAEHIGRYDHFMRAVAAAGFIVCGHDHLGHGKTAADETEYGYFRLSELEKVKVNVFGYPFPLERDKGFFKEKFTRYEDGDGYLKVV